MALWTNCLKLQAIGSLGKAKTRAKKLLLRASDFRYCCTYFEQITFASLVVGQMSLVNMDSDISVDQITFASLVVGKMLLENTVGPGNRGLCNHGFGNNLASCSIEHLYPLSICIHCLLSFCLCRWKQISLGVYITDWSQLPLMSLALEDINPNFSTP